MKRYALILNLLFLFEYGTAQETGSLTEQKLENSTAGNEDTETEDDSYLQQLQQFLKNPLQLNSAGEAELRELGILNPLQVQNFISYRNLVGPLIDIYELQAVPGWDLRTIQRLRPYVAVSLQAEVWGALKSGLKKGEHVILIRTSRVLERPKGYTLDPAVATNFYPGSPQKLLIRYKYHYKNLLQYGVVAEKDAGEQFFKGGQKQGFDFYSFHLFVRKPGLIRALAAGDFTVNLGQGMIQWQTLAFTKSADVINVKREAAVLRPYHSAGEINFHRGLGITLSRRRWELTAFISYRNIDANLIADSSGGNVPYVSSLQTSGYHRTKAETDDKGIQRQLTVGGNISCSYRGLHLGINAVHYKFKLPLVKKDEPYNQYALSGKTFGNYSFDYSYTFKNIHFFGELAFTSSFKRALLTGLMASVSPSADLVMVYRNISALYQSLYTSAFTENSYPTNEKGIYAGITLRPDHSWRIDAYFDLYQFPWLKYRVDAPSYGYDHLVQLTYRPGRQLEIYSRYHGGSKAVNVNPGNLRLSPVLRQPVRNWRTQIIYQPGRRVTLRTRAEVSWFEKGGISGDQGFLFFFDFLYKPAFKPFAGNLRLQYFETGGYNSRLYAYENDVLYSFSIPVFYDKGYRYYLNINYEINKKLGLWGRFSQTICPGKSLTGSGLDETVGNKRSEVKIQIMYRL